MANTAVNPHAVVFPLPTSGHVNPMLHLATRLARDGVRISFIVSEFNHNLSPLTPPHPSFSSIPLPDGLPPHHGRTTDPMHLCQTISFHPTMHNAFLHFLQSSQASDAPVTCIISDTFVLFAQDVAKTLSLPYVAFWTQSAASYTCMYRVATGYRPPKDSDALITIVPGIPPLKQNEMNTFLQCYDPEDPAFDFMTRPFGRMAEADSVLINTFHELESETIDALQQEHNVSAVGPLLPPEIFQPSQVHDRNSKAGSDLEAEDCIKWLDLQSPASVLYVSFGSIAVISQEQFVEFARGLEDSGQPFLWVLRKNLIKGASPVYPDGFVERTRGRAYFVPWAPQLKVLKHPSIGGFLTHCGWNSVLESVSTGVPLLCWAYFSDQMTNCKCVVDGWKAGLRLQTSSEAVSVGRLEVKEKVRQLIEGDTGDRLRQNAQAWRRCGLETVQEGGISFDNIKALENLIVHGATKGNQKPSK